MRKQETVNINFWISIKALLWKNAVGSALIFVASAANLTAFYVDKAVQLGWLCLLACVVDGEFTSFLLFSHTPSSFPLRWARILHTVQS